MIRLEKAWLKPAILCVAALYSLLSLPVLAQADASAVLENIRPVGRLCLAGQDCTEMMTSSVTTAAVSEPAAEPAIPAATQTAAAEAPAFDVAATYQMTCFACHGTGAAGAPKTGDKAAWDPRIAKGMDTVVANAMNGLNVMPAKGMCMTCSESDIRALIEYMLNPI